MVYKAIGLMSGSSLDGLDIAYVHFHETAGRWSFEIHAAECAGYSPDLTRQLGQATALNASAYLLLHAAYGHYLGEQVNAFIKKYDLEHKVDLISSHGHTTFHDPANSMTAQLGDGSAIAAITGLPVVSDLRALDVARSGQGAPIVPIGEKLLFPEYDILLNLGGIANVSFKSGSGYAAFDVCAANRVLNMLSAEAGKTFDDGGQMASAGNVSTGLLNKLNALSYYQQGHPKSLPNQFGTDTVYPIVQQEQLTVPDALRTYVEHIVSQIQNSIVRYDKNQTSNRTMLVTGGGALNTFMVQCLQDKLRETAIQVIVPSTDIVSYKEALIMALIGVLRWREEYNVLSSVTGATRDSIGGALWLGTEA